MEGRESITARFARKMRERKEGKEGKEAGTEIPEKSSEEGAQEQSEEAAEKELLNLEENESFRQAEDYLERLTELGGDLQHVMETGKAFSYDSGSGKEFPTVNKTLAEMIRKTGAETDAKAAQIIMDRWMNTAEKALDEIPMIALSQDDRTRIENMRLEIANMRIKSIKRAA